MWPAGRLSVPDRALSGEFRQQQRLGQHGTAEHCQVEALVDAVPAARRVPDAGDQHRCPGERARELRDERDGPADPGLHHRVAVRPCEGAPCGVVGGTRAIQRERFRDAGFGGDRDVGAPRHVRLEVISEGALCLEGVVARPEPHAHPCPGVGKQDVRRLGDSWRVHPEHRDGGFGPSPGKDGVQRVEPRR